MKKTWGVILIIAGLAMLILGSVTYTKKEKVIDAGPIEISADKQKTLNWPPYFGGVLTVAGIVLLVTARGKD